MIGATVCYQVRLIPLVDLIVFLRGTDSVAFQYDAGRRVRVRVHRSVSLLDTRTLSGDPSPGANNH